MDVSNGFLHLESRILEGKDPEALSMLWSSLELMVEGRDGREMDISDHSVAPLTLTQSHAASTQA